MSNIHGLNDLNRNQQNGVGYNRMNQRAGVNPQPMMMDEEAKEAVVLFQSASGESSKVWVFTPSVYSDYWVDLAIARMDNGPQLSHRSGKTTCELSVRLDNQGSWCRS